MSLYLLLNIGSFILPFAYSFESRMRFINRWRAVLSGISITAFFFIVWDIIFTRMGVWSFNERYHSGLAFLGLPIEEWLFFFCIPYASLFIHFVFQHFFPKIMLSDRSVKGIYGLAMIVTLPIIGLFFGRLYTTVSLILLVLLLTYGMVKMPSILKTFFITFLIILIPFSLVNGILTGSFIEEPVVIYNNTENLGIRLGTIPIEDTAYAFSMLLMSLILIEKIEKATKMKIYKLETVQHINADLEKCWEFFSSPQNLQTITPKNMGFEITDFDGKSMYQGQIIQYNISPLLGIKMPWVTEITHVKENRFFIDEQRFGPYALWHHKHFFEPTESGVIMTDLVHYALPMGILGRMMNSLMVQNRLKEIFDYRFHKINEIFNSK